MDFLTERGFFVEGIFLILAAILLPAAGAALSYVIKKSSIRNCIVVITSIAMMVVSSYFAYVLYKNGGQMVIETEKIPFDLGWIIKLIDIALLVYIVFLGFKLKNILVWVLAGIQLAVTVGFEVFNKVVEPHAAFVIDYLSLIMLLLSSIIGPLIIIFATGYMKEHEEHQHLKKSRQPKFFFVLFIFLAAMNALAVSNNIMWFYLFWEVTTLCSFLLISHDGSEMAIKNATRALVLNMAGGVAFIFGIVVLYKVTGTLSLQDISMFQTTGAVKGLVPLGLALLCFAGFTKSAQFPFQSWLLGAMVAPTPVSALLHSSTMVKAGVYLVVRIAPAFSGTILGHVVAFVGGFTFMAASALAISQRNGKKVLAYSTIANLGLIICCAGIGTHVALGAAILLIIFHAISKGLLFLCVGTIEHGIGSRDIEDMQGLMKKMPFTTVITVIGMISMLLPPFGVLITKWMAIEASVNLPIVLIPIIIGSAFTVVFWAKWIGIILTMSYKVKHPVEKLPFSTKATLSILVAGVLAASVGIIPLFNKLISPELGIFKLVDKLGLVGEKGGVWMTNGTTTITGGFASLPFFLIIFALMFTIPFFLYKTKPDNIKPPYVCGELANDDIRGIEFMGPMDKIENSVVHNYYFKGVLGENKLTLWTNLVAIASILIMFGVVVK